MVAGSGERYATATTIQLQRAQVTDLNNKLTLVTGAAGGFGAHLVSQLLDAGARLIITDKDPAALDGLCDQHADREDRIVSVVTADLSSHAGCNDLISAVSSLDDGLDVLVNNAGIAVAGRLDHVPSARWETLMQVNLLAPMRLTAAFLPQMVKRGSGHIVNISSLAGWVGSPGLSSYCAAKFGLRGFGEALGMELDEFDIRVSTVFPSFSDTPILDSAQFGFDKPRAVPREFLSDPADVVTRILNGIRRDKTLVFPDRTALVTHYLARFMPWTIPILQRRLDRKAQEAAAT